ncbi:hypothetical protein BS50DRAFT_153220 [Corynespora cassiicola Philippines]|uniref:Uncharacterized protein n=1 Tax=Corynespora cassiicola Philippines TaxID=1448308 RepID=A0A2T2N826_CORCC|nr:hypothetical protein BS50DRAFT_153220 [Corynespora cassiicola Philippines]
MPESNSPSTLDLSQMDRWTERQTHGQIDRETDTKPRLKYTAQLHPHRVDLPNTYTSTSHYLTHIATPPQKPPTISGNQGNHFCPPRCRAGQGRAWPGKSGSNHITHHITPSPLPPIHSTAPKPSRPQSRPRRQSGYTPIRNQADVAGAVRQPHRITARGMARPAERPRPWWLYQDSPFWATDTWTPERPSRRARQAKARQGKASLAKGSGQSYVP